MSLAKYVGTAAVMLLVLVMGCASATSPGHDPTDISDCPWVSQSSQDQECVLGHMDEMSDSPLHGIIARQLVNGVSRIIHIDQESGKNRVIVANAWNQAHPVWIPGHRAIAYDVGGNRAGLPFISTNGKLVQALTLWLEAPPYRHTEPMFGNGVDDFAFLFQWTGYYGDTTRVTVDGISLGDFGNPVHCRMSRDGRWIVCQATNTRGIFRINRQTTQVQHVVQGEVYEPALSPDGTRLVYGSVYRPHIPGDPFYMIVLATIAESGTVTPQDTLAAPRFQHSVSSPIFSPDGQSVAYVFNRGDSPDDEITEHKLGLGITRNLIIPGQIARLDWQ